MRRNSKLIIVLLILLISIGFAFLSSQLDLIGSSLLRKQEWDIHFESPTKVGGNVDASSLVLTDSTTVNFTVDLLQPKDTYEFTVDIVNDGSIDGMISSISGTELTTNQKKVFEYVITYDDGAALKEKQLLAHNSSDKFKVTVRYKDDISSSDLSIDNQTVNITITVNYVQADNTAFNRVSGSFVSLYNQTTPGVLAQGDEVNIGDEHFYIVNIDDDKTVLLTKYNLNVGRNVDSKYNTGIQSKRVHDRYGAVPFSNIDYWHDSNGNIFSTYGEQKFHNNINDTSKDSSSGNNYSVTYYINNYVDYLETLGAENIVGRVITLDEFVTYFNLEYPNNYENINYKLGSGNFFHVYVPLWVTYPNYWIATSNDVDYTWVISSSNLYEILSNFSNWDGVRLRPIIIVSNSYI